MQPFRGLILLSCLLVALHSVPIYAADFKLQPLPGDLDERINKGLAYLARQQKADGSFESEGSPAAMTGLSILAFLSCGHTPDVGKYGLTVRGAVDYLLKLAPDNGYFGTDGSRMDGHAIVTLALAEVYGTETDPVQRRKVRAVLEQVVAVIVDGQSAEKKEKSATGGWRYEPRSDDSDLFVTSWCMLALRAAENAGLAVSKETTEGATNYLMACYRDDQKGFAYKPKRDSTISITGAAVLLLGLSNNAKLPEAQAGVKYLVEHQVNDQTPTGYLSIYYATQAAAQVGDPTWAIVWKTAYEQLAKRQMNEGAWRPGPDEQGRIDHTSNGQQKILAVYPTSMAILALSVPYRLMPVFQK